MEAYRKGVDRHADPGVALHQGLRPFPIEGELPSDLPLLVVDAALAVAAGIEADAIVDGLGPAAEFHQGTDRGDAVHAWPGARGVASR
jgi:hypothetical protein